MAKDLISIDLDEKKVNTQINKVNDNSKIVNDIVNSIIVEYCKDLDDLISQIHSILFNPEEPISDSELESSLMKLSSTLYFISEKQEEMGVKEDISKAFYNEVFNSTRDSLTSGTVSDKDSYAKLKSQQELLTNMIFSRCYKKIKYKVESAYELLTSMKKVISRRISALELSKSDRDRYNATGGYNENS